MEKLIINMKTMNINPQVIHHSEERKEREEEEKVPVTPPPEYTSPLSSPKEKSEKKIKKTPLSLTKMGKSYIIPLYSINTV